MRRSSLDPLARARFDRRACLVGLAACTLAVPARARSFGDFLAEVAAEARARGIGAATIDAALTGLTPDPRVVDLDRRQPERQITFQEYRRRVVSPTRIETGRARHAAHRDLLEPVGREYGVQPRIIVALWGIESSFGRVTGDHAVIRSLATLAYDGRRAELFTAELLAALELLERTPIVVEELVGSWAGAMGQAQFLPSTYIAHAVDRDGDGWADIWRSEADVFASMANYLHSIGWRPGWRWGREVTRANGFDGLPLGRDDKRALAWWAAQGLRRADGGPLPVADAEAGLIVTDDGTGPAYLVYDNFDVLMRWNRSTFFALCVGLLSDSL